MHDFMHGFLAFVADGEEKIVRADRDFEPHKLGLGTLATLRTSSDWMAGLARELRTVKPDQVTGIDQADLVSLDRDIEKRPTDLARLVLRAGVARDAGGAPSDSGAVVWGYVVDFQFGRFEVYEGLQVAAHTDGRYCQRPLTSCLWHPVRLVAGWPLPGRFSGAEVLPSDEEFLSTIKREARTASCPGV